MSLLASLKRPGPSGFGFASTALQVTEGLDLSAKTYLLTGATAGLGLEVLRALGRRGAHVIATGRSAEKASEALGTVGATGTPIACELSEPSSVRAAAASVRALGRPLDGIICNAGIMALPKLEQRHGLELQFLTNHLGHYILVTQLLETLGPQARVVVVSSSAHKFAPPAGIDFDNLDGSRGYNGWRAYGQAKLANVLFARKLARRFRGSARTANALHPGVIKTTLQRHMGAVSRALMNTGEALFMKTVEQGAATETWLAVSPTAAGLNGEYCEDCNVSRPSRLALDDELADRLWSVSEELAAKLA